MALTNIERIKQLLGNGLPNEVVASTVGVHPSYITQLMSDETFAQEVIEARTATLASHTLRDRSLDSIEDKLIDKINAALDDGLVYKHRDVLHTFRIINAAKRRGVPTTESTIVNNTVVNLTLPSTIVQRFVTNTANEVVAIDDQTMVTMPAANLLKNLVDAKSDDKVQIKKYQTAAKFLPTPPTAPSNTVNKLLSDSSKGNPEDVRTSTQELAAD